MKAQPITLNRQHTVTKSKSPILSAIPPANNPPTFDPTLSLCPEDKITTLVAARGSLRSVDPKNRKFRPKATPGSHLIYWDGLNQVIWLYDGKEWHEQQYAELGTEDLLSARRHVGILLTIFARLMLTVCEQPDRQVTPFTSLRHTALDGKFVDKSPQQIHSILRTKKWAANCIANTCFMDQTVIRSHTQGFIEGYGVGSGEQTTGIPVIYRTHSFWTGLLPLAMQLRIIWEDD